MSLKVAVFGCVHGMLNEMYNQVKLHEEKHGKVDFIIVCGDCQTIRHADDLKCLNVPPKYRSLGDFHDYYSGKKQVPKMTIFVGGNHEASNYLMTLPYGGWVCDNFYYLGYSGVIKYRGFRIAGVSGIYNNFNHRRGRYESMPLNDDSIRSIYHTRRLDIFRLQLLQSKIEQDPLDILISHDWPNRIYDHGNKEQLLRFKPGFRKDVESRYGLGNPLTKPLVGELKPKRWFAAHLHCRFYAKVKHDQNRQTEFLSLNKIGNGQNYMEILHLEPSRPDDILDDELYYDEEWLSILRKTIDLEDNSANNVFCPSMDSDLSLPYIPNSDDIDEIIQIMNKCKDGFRIPRNFSMVEPVIYNRPGNGPTSIDSRREQYFPNPQTELLCEKIKLHEVKKVAKPVAKFCDPVKYENDRDEHMNCPPRTKKLALDPDQSQSKSIWAEDNDDDDGCLDFCIDTKGEP